MTSAPRGYAKGRATREQILDEAMTLFGEVGYRSASLREIAARSGISHPGLLHHFAHKEALLAAVLQRRDELDSAQFPSGRGPGLERLQALVDLVEHNTHVPGIVELFAALSTEAIAPDHPAHAYFVRRYELIRASLTDSLEVTGEQGLLRDGVDPELAAVVIVAVMDGLQIQWLLDRASVDMVRTLREHIAGLLSVPFMAPVDAG
ncbi:MAG: TetR/AcrR family transcriptional regulator [Cellulomonas sp.]